MKAKQTFKRGRATNNPDIIKYLICKHFHVLPSQVDKEDSIELLKLLTVFSADKKAEYELNKIQQSRAKRGR